MTAVRLPAHLEVAALIRLVEAHGGFGTVLSKGERDGGAILIVTTERGENAHLWERMPMLDGERIFTRTDAAFSNNPMELHEYLVRRTTRDPDLWVVELDIRDSERFIAQLPQ